MKYVGSKRRFSKYIVPIIEGTKKFNGIKWTIEPFMGGANLTENLETQVFASDVNSLIVSLFNAMLVGWIPPKQISEDFYNKVRSNPDSYTPHLQAYVGFSMSFGGKLWGGYARSKKGKPRDYSAEAFRNYTKQQQKLKEKGVLTLLSSPFAYQALPLFTESLIYCDPPYANSLNSYNKGSFDTEAFWVWVQEKVKEDHIVMVSEYQAPSDFVAIWEKETLNSINTHHNDKKAREKLFIHKKQQERIKIND